MLPLLAFVTAGSLAVPAVAVEGTLDCPSAARVSDELEQIIPGVARAAVDDRAIVVSDAGVLLVLLRAADGSVLGERQVVVEGTCEEQARAVAVILGAWITDIHPEYRSALPLPSVSEGAPAATEAPAATATGEPSAAPAPQGAPPIRRPLIERSRLVRRDQALPGTAARRWSIAAGVGVEIADAGAVAAGSLSGSYAPNRSGFGGTAFVLAAAPAERAVGAGRASAFRWPLGLGALARVQGREACLDVSAGPTLGWLHVEGDEFASNRAADDVVAGAFGRVRLGARWSSFRPFFEAGVLGWFGRSTIAAQQPVSEIELPAIEAFFLLGMGFEP